MQRVTPEYCKVKTLSSSYSATFASAIEATCVQTSPAALPRPTATARRVCVARSAVPRALRNAAGANVVCLPRAGAADASRLEPGRLPAAEG